MSAVVFLLLALVIIVVGSVAVYLRQRTPSSLDAGIEGFRREMNALAVRNGNGTANGNGHGSDGVPGMSQVSTTTGASETAGPPGPPGPVEGEG
jgi:hypothetical protein